MGSIILCGYLQLLHFEDFYCYRKKKTRNFCILFSATVKEDESAYNTRPGLKIKGAEDIDVKILKLCNINFILSLNICHFVSSMCGHMFFIMGKNWKILRTSKHGVFIWASYHQSCAEIIKLLISRRKKIAVKIIELNTLYKTKWYQPPKKGNK